MIISLFFIFEIIFSIFCNLNLILSYVIFSSYSYRYNHNKYFFQIIIIGLIYDLIFTDVIGMHSLIFYIISLLITKNKNSNIYFLSFFSILIYYLTLNFVFYLINNINFNFIYFIKCIIINYILFFSMKYIFDKLKK